MQPDNRRPAPLMLCADDFGLSPGVSRGILELAAARRLTATSCMSVAPGWAAAARDLPTRDAGIEIGLHLTLTDQTPLGPMPVFAPAGRMPPIGTAIRMGLSRALPYAEIKAEIARQLDAFEAALGRRPDFVDGHQHVHLVPGVRRAVLDLFRENRLDARQTWLRDCFEPFSDIVRRGVSVMRASVISALAGGFRSAAGKAGIVTNLGFRGVNDFRTDLPFRDVFRRFLVGSGARPLVMCHPGHVDEALVSADSVAARREQELRYFRSDAFLDDLARAGVRLAPFPRADSAGAELRLTPRL